MFMKRFDFYELYRVWFYFKYATITGFWIVTIKKKYE
jgi:hypothetical protein